jgi:hypothetical protein
VQRRGRFTNVDGAVICDNDLILLLHRSTINQMKEEIKKITCRVVKPNDISRDEEIALKAYKIYQIPYDHLILSAYRPLVTGTSFNGPADIMSTTHWLSRAPRCDRVRYYTRFGTARISAGSVHQLLAAVFFGRRAVWGTSVSSMCQPSLPCPSVYQPSASYH